MDENFSLKNDASFSDVISFSILDGQLEFGLENGQTSTLNNSDQFQGFQGSPNLPSSILLKNNNLHAEIQIDPEHSVGATDPAGIKDVLLESAVTTIQDWRIRLRRLMEKTKLLFIEIGLV